MKERLDVRNIDVYQQAHYYAALTVLFHVTDHKQETDGFHMVKAPHCPTQSDMYGLLIYAALTFSAKTTMQLCKGAKQLYLISLIQRPDFNGFFFLFFFLMWKDLILVAWMTDS